MPGKMAVETAQILNIDRGSINDEVSATSDALSGAFSIMNDKWSRASAQDQM